MYATGKENVMRKGNGSTLDPADFASGRARRAGFIFRVNGTEMQGAVTVHMNYEVARVSTYIARAARIAARRAGDPNPEFLELVPPKR